MPSRGDRQQESRGSVSIGSDWRPGIVAPDSVAGKWQGRSDSYLPAMFAPHTVAALAARLRIRPRTRFAPAPTGYLHLGHVSSALHVWKLARALGGEVLLRIEDHDRGRCRPEYERAILEDLEWLGLVPDLGAAGEYRTGPAYRQSDRGHSYEAALDRLSQKGLVYACRCSRREIAEAAGGTDGEESRYPGTCRDAGHEREGAGLRLRMDPGEERFDDGLADSCIQDPSLQCGDMLIRDRLGNWTYQFAVTVDDIEQEIDLVVRGTDLLNSTGRQIRLARLLGRTEPPVFVHHPLILGPDGRKLSKSSGDTGVRELREQGLDVERVREMVSGKW